MGPDPSDWEAVTTRRGLHLYLHIVKGWKDYDRVNIARSQCFAENTENEAFLELSVLKLTEEH